MLHLLTVLRSSRIAIVMRRPIEVGRLAGPATIESEFNIRFSALRSWSGQACICAMRRGVRLRLIVYYSQLRTQYRRCLRWAIYSSTNSWPDTHWTFECVHRNQFVWCIFHRIEINVSAFSLFSMHSNVARHLDTFRPLFFFSLDIVEMTINCCDIGSTVKIETETRSHGSM